MRDREYIITEYAYDLYDSIDFIEYVKFKLDYSKEDRKILFGLEQDRRVKDDEYIEIAHEVSDEFIEVVKDY